MEDVNFLVKAKEFYNYVLEKIQEDARAKLEKSKYKKGFVLVDKVDVLASKFPEEKSIFFQKGINLNMSELLKDLFNLRVEGGVDERLVTLFSFYPKNYENAHNKVVISFSCYNGNGDEISRPMFFTFELDEEMSLNETLDFMDLKEIISSKTKFFLHC